MTANRKSTAPAWHDPDDAPDLSTPEWQAKFAKADVMKGDKIVRRGRPALETPKVSTTVRLDADILDHFKAGGAKWQTRLNDALRAWIATDMKRTSRLRAKGKTGGSGPGGSRPRTLQAASPASQPRMARLRVKPQ